MPTARRPDTESIALPVTELPSAACPERGVHGRHAWASIPGHGKGNRMCPGVLVTMGAAGGDGWRRWENLDDAETASMWHRLLRKAEAQLDAVRLTEDEQHAMDLTGELAGVCRRIVGDGPASTGDWSEMCRAIHDIQARILSQLASRTDPPYARPLGGRKPTCSGCGVPEGQLHEAGCEMGPDAQ